jgi:hypothetical protein
LLGLLAMEIAHRDTAAAAGAIMTASLMFSTFVFPYRPWNTALIPVLVGVASHLIFYPLRQAQQKNASALPRSAWPRRPRCQPTSASPPWYGAVDTVSADRLARVLATCVGTIAHLRPRFSRLAEAAADTVSSKSARFLVDRRA